jgi:hypothetical protein
MTYSSFSNLHIEKKERTRDRENNKNQYKFIFYIQQFSYYTILNDLTLDIKETAVIHSFTVVTFFLLSRTDVIHRTKNSYIRSSYDITERMIE